MVMIILAIIAWAVALAAAAANEWRLRPHVPRPLAQAGNEATFLRGLRRQNMLKLAILPALWLTPWLANSKGSWFYFYVVMSFISALALISVLSPTWRRSVARIMQSYV